MYLYLCVFWFLLCIVFCYFYTKKACKMARMQAHGFLYAIVKTNNSTIKGYVNPYQYRRNIKFQEPFIVHIYNEIDGSGTSIVSDSIIHARFFEINIFNVLRGLFL